MNLFNSETYSDKQRAQMCIEIVKTQNKKPQKDRTI